jgi:PKD repeat protein
MSWGGEMSRERWATAFLVGFFLSIATGAAGPALVRIERKAPEDRTALIRAGVPLVAERDTCLLAAGRAEQLASLLESLGYTWALLDADTEGWDYYTLHRRDSYSPATLDLRCEVLWTEERWALVRVPRDAPRPSPDPARWRVQAMPLRPLAESLPPPEEYAELQEGAPWKLAVKPLVQEISNLVTGTVVGTNWDAVINSASTRYSTSSGCLTATQMVYDTFTGLGLSPIKQNHTNRHAPNIVGVIPGKVTPEKVCIIIGHIDDMPETGPAPGANDNASGAATVMSAAQVMAPYAFASTVKFLVVTGEEFDLYGSWYYADQAKASGEQIQGVLCGDMIGWEGDGLPSSGENLDVDCNSASMWLGQLLSQCASDYATGCPINYFLCPIADYSDHYPFWENGYSAVMGITDNEGDCGQDGTYDYYHTSQDTKAHCGSPSFFYTAARAYTATLAHMADPLCKPPAAPASLAATGGVGIITLTWPSAGSGLTYEIWRGQGSCAAATSYAKTGETASTTYTDTGVTPGTTYSYKVVARDSTGYCRSGYSPCAEAAASGATCTLACTATVPPTATAGVAVSFQATATPSNCTGGVTYAWIFGDGGTSTAQNPSHAYGSAGSYAWTMTATVQGVTCAKSGSIVISAPPVCTLACTATVPASAGVGASVAFQSTATPSNCTGSPAYAWTFGDGGTSSSQNPSHAYSSTGSYPWTLTATVQGVTCSKSGNIAIGTCPCAQDVSCDGSVNVIDMVRIQRVILGLDPQTACPRCDVNGDGSVNVVDMIKVQRVILGLDACA